MSALRARIGDVLTHVATRRERVVLTRHGREVGALVPMDDLETLRALDRDQSSRTLCAYRASWSRVTGPTKQSG